MPFDIPSGNVRNDHGDEVTEHGSGLAFVAHVGLIEGVAVRAHPSRNEVVKLVYESSPAVLGNAVDGPKVEPALTEHVARRWGASGRRTALGCRAAG